MSATVRDSYTYMGLLDDSVSRFPWRFKVDAETLNYLLVVELIHGKPVLLNDGYLINNPLARAALLSRNGLLWELVRNGFVRVMSRGGDEFPLQDMPLRMAPTIPTFDAITHNRVAGAHWPDIHDALTRLDGQLRRAKHLVAWPAFDVGSGFLALVENLRERRASAHVLGLGRHVGKNTFTSFIDEVAERLARDTTAARTVWEQTAVKYAQDANHTNTPELFVHALMNLANEMYHYNMGILLTADHGANVSVQTQTSAAFDDLLIPPSLKFLLQDVPDLPRLHVSMSVMQVNPLILAGIVDEDTAVGEARRRWLLLRDAWEAAPSDLRATGTSELRDAGEAYAARLSEYLGPHFKFKESEELLEFVVGDVARVVGAAAATVALAAAGAPAAIVAAGSIGGYAIGYAITRVRKKALGSVFRKVRVQVLEKSFTMPRALAERSAQVLHTIKRRKVPSTIQITPSVATAFASKLKPHKR